MSLKFYLNRSSRKKSSNTWKKSMLKKKKFQKIVSRHSHSRQKSSALFWRRKSQFQLQNNFRPKDNAVSQLKRIELRKKNRRRKLRGKRKSKNFKINWGSRMTKGRRWPKSWRRSNSREKPYLPNEKARKTWSQSLTRSNQAIHHTKRK